MNSKFLSKKDLFLWKRNAMPVILPQNIQARMRRNTLIDNLLPRVRIVL